ncbi:DsbE family thiol:disulfide interchange protein [Chitinibacter bivalviorum]|uniref:DsbE family thiol:disulfide interchange protein n=1 Tax=Chitinibacter bivalviorum TaxID=2739434 RepID=A0A7H9BGM0_9NEIS|nr:DsbE family thiol:disulfide interchange protein [Chitinibacter bivalviorum]QLG87757.1 DsbE family thiol:disulfide interchange protein [Chitinibacter bivalviorum]
MKRYLPLIIFVALAGLLSYGLRLNPRDIPSPLIGKPAPVFTLDRLEASKRGEKFHAKSLLGQPWVLNVWASWCSACVVEHPVLNRWQSKLGVPLVGMAYKDSDDDSQKWLAARGNPYTVVIADRDGRVGIDFGVYGVPETFVIDAQGTIVLKHTGPVSDDVFADKIMPALQQARRNQAGVK